MIADIFDVIEQEELNASTLGSIIYGWTAIHPELIRKIKRLCGDGVIPVEILGQTEAISCHRFWPDKWPEIFEASAPTTNYVGVPNPMVAGDIWDAEGNSLRGVVGQPGEVVYRSPVITAGYYRDEAATQEAFRGGWFHSGDVCEYDKDGLRIMVDRWKDIVKSGGENVSTLRVESILVQHPAIQKAAVVGLPHIHWGEAVTAFVIPKDGQTIDPAEVIAFCRQTLAGFETPKLVVAVPELPTTVGGKVLKYKIRQANADIYDTEASE